MDFYFGTGYMQYLNDMPQQLVDKMTPSVENIPVFIALVISMTVGYMLYTYAGKVAKEQGVEPYPIWIHCYILSIDIIGTITFWYLAATHGFFWYFDLMGVALPIWIVMEVKSIKAGIQNERARNMEWGKLRQGGVTEKDALLFAFGIFFVSFCLNMWALSMLGGMSNAAIWIIYAWTNYVYTIWNWRFWEERAAETGMRAYNSLGLQVVVFLATFVSWCPGLSMFWAVSPFFHTPWFLLGGFGVSVIGIYNIYRCRKYPPFDADKLVLKDVSTYEN